MSRPAGPADQPDLDPAADVAPGPAWCADRTTRVDRWLARLFGAATGAGEATVDAAAGAAVRDFVLVAVGGYGRAELCPRSDLDVLLLHKGRSTAGRVGEVAERLWYPIWDTGLKLGHSVRTPKEALALAADDLDTATALLDGRVVAGDVALADALLAKVAAQWRQRSRHRLEQLRAAVDERHARAGEVAFLLEPDLKEGRGGLRDVHALRWAEAATSILLPRDHDDLADAHDALLGVRVALHLEVGRATDVLRLQDQDAVAARAGLADADALMAQVAGAGRRIAWTADDVWDRISSALAGPKGRTAGGAEPVAPGVVVRDDEVALAADADLDDPVLVLRVAATAATRDLPVDRHALDRLAEQAPALPEPWPEGARAAFVALLGAGRPTVRVVEALDQRGLFTRVLPEWEPVRSRPQRNAYHRYTVDRHLLEVVAGAAALADRVDRPDLLVVGALLHDLGKGRPGDHTDNGVALAEQLAPRMGFDEDDAAVLVDLVRHHLLLPDVATRRDLDDPDTIRGVAAAVHDERRLHLLAALTEADSLATGPSAWGDWKARLVADLVRRTERVLHGAPGTAEAFPSSAHRRLMARGRAVEAEGDTLAVVAPDRPGHLSRVAGVVALHGLDVLGAAAHSEEGTALTVVRVAAEPEGGWEPVVADLEDALAGRLALAARLAERARTYRRRTPLVDARAEVHVDLAASASATVVEVHAPDALGLFHRVAAALAALDLDVRRALVQTLGDRVVDTFYVVDPQGRKVTDRAHLTEIERALLHATDEVT